jgi:hypothetical protein
MLDEGSQGVVRVEQASCLCHSRDGCGTSAHRPAEAGLVRAALKRTNSRDSGATREFGMRNFSSTLTSELEHRGSGSSPTEPRTP